MKKKNKFAVTVRPPWSNEDRLSIKWFAMNILVTGSNGQLGSELRDLGPAYPDFRFFFTDKEDLDVTSGDAVYKYLKKNDIGCLINCVGYTAVDLAEDDREGAALLNTAAAKSMAEATARTHALMVHVSTDYVFEGKGFRPYTENDTASPRTIYGKTKLEGEIEVIFNAKRSVIIRTSWLYSSHGSNFVKTILGKAATEKELRVVYDQVGTPTYAADLARAILHMIPRLPSRVRGEIYNYSNEGVASWFDFAKAILDFSGADCRLLPVLTKDIEAAAARPHYSVLNKDRIKREFGLDIPYWRDSLKACLGKLKE
jgi:dTDP-4-dehydrorhamnose reductase